MSRRYSIRSFIVLGQKSLSKQSKHPSERRFLLYSKWKHWFLTENVLSGTFCLFCYCALFLQVITPKIISWPKMVFTYAIFIVNWKFGKLLLENTFYLSLEFKLLIFLKNTVKISEILNKGNELVKNLPQVYVPNQFLHTIQSFSLRVKMKISKPNEYNKTCLFTGSYDKLSCIKS